MRENRHGREARADHDRRRRPSDGFRVRDTARFQRIAEDALSGLPAEILDPLSDAELLIVDIPPEPAADEHEVPLVAFEPGGRPRLTLYRRPLEARALGRPELSELVRLAVGREVALTLGLDLDFDDDWD
jgi:predicted Zn-dependent protease with MMP-like domain